MPADNGFGLDDDEVVLPLMPPSAEVDPEYPVPTAETCPSLFGLQNGELVSESEVLEDEVTPVSRESKDGNNEAFEDSKHRGRACSHEDENASKSTGTEYWPTTGHYEFWALSG